MALLYYTLGVLVFVVAMLASIALHEVGHMVPARAFGGKVTQYFVGFGPTVWSKQVGETEYGVKAIPLGGYVKIIGMLPPGAAQLADAVETDADGNQVLKVRKSNTGLFTQLISDARAAEWELVQPEDEPRLFYKMTWWKKVVVMAGGPTVNLAIAFFLFWGVFATVGNDADRAVSPVVAQVSGCVVPAAQDQRACTRAELREHPSPAAAAGLKAGDRFLSWNGERITSWEQVQGLIRGNGAKTATLVVERDGERVALQVTTQVTPRPLDAEHPTKLEPVGFLGVVPVSEARHGGPLYTLGQMGGMVRDSAHAIAVLPVKVWHVGMALVGLEERDPNGPVSIVGGGRFAGEVAAQQDFPLQDKIVSLISLVAGFNFFVGMFNFVPLLPLDGGHIAGALWEGVRRGWARVFHRPDPGHVDVARLLPVAYVMTLAFVLMGVVLILADLIIPVKIYG
ncbi:M50 family metallopeptidase [Nocardioides jiangxiensis]|uniref:Site-2 protease family protein n=1 Tax=Nocardioides jiangxiensis TaxID=3064524 RepID=A0ABT9B307_9ACTN|nr:site-2 protease family protein [Nocardioides sp. WY-20]MDO7869224.1 site-2 protease family protein [Nocardioides sp. WY-20]